MVEIRAKDIRDFLRMRRAPAKLIAWVRPDLQDMPVSAVPAWLAALPRGIPFEAREILLAALMHLSTAGTIDHDVVSMLRGAARSLGIEPGWMAHAIETELGVTLEHLDALSVLALPRGASPIEIKHAHRVLVKRYHPDRLQHLGAEFRDLAQERTATLNQARGVLLEEGDEDDIPLEPVFEDDDVVLEPDLDAEGEIPFIDLDPPSSTGAGRAREQVDDTLSGYLEDVDDDT